MKRFFTPIFALLPVTTYAQSYDLSWFTIDGGGATAVTGGSYELGGTIGQPDASSFSTPISGGAYTLFGGFWPIDVPTCAPLPGWTAYEPCLGTLPQAQGWGYANNGSNSPAVTGAWLHQGPTSPSSLQYWVRDDVPLPANCPFEVEFSLKAINIESAPCCGGQTATGWILDVINAAPREYWVYVANDVVYLGSGHSNPWTVVSTAQETRDAFHVYRMAVDASGVTLFIDSAQRLTLPQPAVGDVGNSPNIVLWADDTVFAASETLLAYLRYKSACSVGDINCDGAINAGDAPAFVLALLDPAAYAAAYPGCNIAHADFNGDGAIDGADVQMFVTLIMHP